MKPMCRAILALNVLYCFLAAAQEGLPGWHMFESVEDVGHDLRDREWSPSSARRSVRRGHSLIASEAKT